MPGDLIIDLFAGPGGWDVGARMIGMPDPLGIELDDAACATRAAAGLRTVQADISRFPAAQLAGRHVKGVIGSPPCVVFSSAGARAGNRLTGHLEAMIRDQFAGRHTLAAHRRAMAAELLASGWLDGPPMRMTPAEWRARRQAGLRKHLQDRRRTTRAGRLRAVYSRPRGYFTRSERQARIWAAVRSASLVAEPARFIAACWPEWVALEQVPEVLPLWRVYAAELRARGYNVWCGILNAADYGVPQTRRRAILIASRTRRVTCPPPTHYDPRGGMALFGDPWVSMAEALQFGATSVPAPAVTAGGTRTGGAETFGHRSRNMLATEQAAGRWMLHTNRGQEPGGNRQVIDPHSSPAPSLTAKSGGQWVMRRQVSGQRAEGRRDHPADGPAPTITGGGSSAGSGNGTGLQWALRRDRGPAMGERRDHPADEPAPTITGGGPSGHGAGPRLGWVLRSGQSIAGEGRAIRDLDKPAVTVTGTIGRAAWTEQRPSTTVLGEPRIGRPGHKGRERGGESHFAAGSVRVTVAEAATLQSFPDAYPWQGNSGRQYEQVGNAVPPRLAAHVLAEVTGAPSPA